MVDASIARHFSHAAAGYSRLRSAGPLKRIRSTEQAAVQEVADVSPGSLVLDAGCGDGATLEWLHARGALAVGVDLTIAMANLSRARGYPAAVQDLEELGLRPVFDRVLCIGVLEFVPDPARALKNLGACLAPDGKLVLLYPRKGPLGLLYAWYHRTHGARIHLFGTGDIASLLARAGLDPPTEHRACSLSSVCASSLPERNL